MGLPPLVNLGRRLAPLFRMCAPLGRLVFRASIWYKRVGLLFGSWSQRAVEYPWVLRQLELIKPGSLVLDVGCSESLLSHELIMRGFKVVCIDIRDYPFKNKYMIFLKRNVLNTKLPSNYFDAIIVVSTIEHIGLNAYNQDLIDEEGDIKAMKELFRILKPGGILILTTPYIGGGPFKISLSPPPEREYDNRRLKKLIEDFIVVKDEYFYPLQVSGKLYWIKIEKRKIDKLNFREPGLACLVLKKPQSPSR